MEHAPRSALYVPASRARAVEKAHGLGCDAVILDLEDAVAPDAKDAARAAAVEACALDWGHRVLLVRVNGAATAWGDDDRVALAGRALVVPKAEAPADLDLPGDGPVWAMIETPRGVLAAPALAAHPRCAGLIAGTNDLAADLRATGRAALGHALAAIVLAARAHGRACLDGVFTAPSDMAGLTAECAEGRALGFDGKTLIHPAQIAAANAAFGPSAAEIVAARARIDAFAVARARGEAVALHEGALVEGLHVAADERLLARAERFGGRG
ncbi:MAG: HpcH/HpaI aldolase/citrate lyase family protein [Paracoccaceae bacterium]